jgi:hypothetical protein
MEVHAITFLWDKLLFHAKKSAVGLHVTTRSVPNIYGPLIKLWGVKLEIIDMSSVSDTYCFA